MTQDLTELAYMAGIIDGEGCISLYYNTKQQYACSLQVGSTSTELMSWIHERFPGLVQNKRQL